MQIILLAAGKILYGINPLANAIVFTIIFLIFTIIVGMMKPFNYKKCNI